MKLWVKIIIIVFIVSVLAVIAFAVKRWIDLSIVDKHGMINELTVEGVDFTSGGGMRGGHTYITAVRNEDGTAVVSVDNQDYWNAPEQKSEYTAKPELLDEIARIVVETEFWNAADRPLSKDIVLDAPSETLRIRISSGLGVEDITVEENFELTDEENRAWYEIIKLLKDESYKAE